MTKILQIVFVALLLVVVSSGCGEDKNKNLFERSWNLKTLSENGETNIWDMTVTKDNNSATVLETFYNESSIYIGFMIEGKALIANTSYFELKFNGERIGDSLAGSVFDDFKKTGWWQYYILRSGNLNFQINELPDEFTLQFQVIEHSGKKRVFEFELPLKRSNQVIPTTPSHRKL